MYSVVIPTMWKSNSLGPLLEKLIQSHNIGEIILIDNDQSSRKDELVNQDKIVYLPQVVNLYVNPSWNLGVSKSKYEKVMILNDDLDFDLKFLDKLVVDDQTIIGASVTCYTEPEDTDFRLVEPIKRDWGWGCILIFNKRDWVEIPNELKIWCGDDYIYQRFKTKLDMKGVPIITNMSTTSDLPTFNAVKNEDLQIWHAKYS